MTFIFLFTFGLFIGSFLGVLIDRIPAGKPIVFGRSQCETCKHDLEWYELIPIVSFVVQKGKCRNCKRKFSLFYPGIELITGVLFFITYLLLIQNSQLLISSLFFYLFIVSALIVVFFTDLKYGIIPNKIIFPTVLVTFFYLFFFQNPELPIHLISALGASLFFIAVSYIYYFIRHKESLGGGDIKLAFLMGLILGFPNIILAMYVSFLTGAFYSIILILWRQKKLKDSIPFGPFLVFGTLLAFFFGEKVLSLVLPYL